MSVFGLFDIGKSSLLASQTALNVISNNIANVNTPGYSKEDVVLNIATPVETNAGYIGLGVTADSIKRSYDRFIEAQLLGQQQSQSRSAAMDQAWGQIEQLLNEQQSVGLSGPLSDFFNAWNDVATTPESPAARTALLQKAGALIQSTSTIERSIVDTINNDNAAITAGASQINALASDIAALNSQISQDPSGQAISLRDQRDSKLTELAKLVDFSSYEDSSGAITVTVGMRNLVSGVTTNPMSAVRNAGGNQDVYLDGINITSNVQGGQLGGLIASRDDIQNNALTGLRKLTASITQQVNSLHAQGFGLDGSTGNGFFNSLQISTINNSAGASITAAVTNEANLTLDEYKITFNAAGNIYYINNKQTGALVDTNTYDPLGTTINTLPGMTVTISGAVTSTDSFTASPLASAVSSFGVAITDPRKIAAASTAAGLPGDNGIASQISQLTNTAIGNLGNGTFSDYYNGLVTTVGTMKQASADSLTFDNNLLTALQSQHDSVSGVSLDEEAANLLRYQRSYQASAQMIKVADELVQTILNL